MYQEEQNDYFIKDFIDDHFTNKVKSNNLMDKNLSEISGKIFIQLSNNLSHLSMITPNKTILERILKENNYVFRDHSSIKLITSDPDPDSRISDAFTKLGTHDTRCTIKWLIKTLIRIGEIKILKGILDTGPPWIRRINKMYLGTMDNMIMYELKTISKLSVTWMCNGQIYDPRPIAVEEFSTQTLKIQPKEKGYYYLLITECLGYNQLKSDYTVVEDLNKETFKIMQKESTNSKNFALLIGMMTYGHADADLKAAKRDIPQLDDALRKIGFKVFSFSDLNKEQLYQVLNQFAKLIEDAKVVFYYAGHGCNSNNEDSVYLVDKQKIKVIDILTFFMKKSPKALVSIFDMCRDDDSSNCTNGTSMSVSKIPCHDKVALVMTSAPNRKAFERKVYNKDHGTQFETTSNIMRPLLETLQCKGTTEPITQLIASFSTACQEILNDQIPMIHASAITETLGTDSVEFPLFIVFNVKVNGNDIQNDVTATFFHRCFYNVICINIKLESNLSFNPQTNVKEKYLMLFDYIFNTSNDSSINNRACKRSHITLPLYKFRRPKEAVMEAKDDMMEPNNIMLEFDLPNEIISFFDINDNIK